MLMIASAFFWALQILLLGRLVSTYGNPLSVAFLQFLTSGVIGLALGLMLEPLSMQKHHGSLERTALCRFHVRRCCLHPAGSPHNVIRPHPTQPFCSPTESLFAALFGALILGETLTGNQWLGCAMIFSSILLVELLPQLPKLLKSKKLAGQNS